MGFRRTYRAIPVKQVNLELLSEGQGRLGVHVGFDMGKAEVLAVVRWADGHFERPWLVKNPDEIQVLAGLLTRMAAKRPLIMAMEPTGTYGDALRQALSDAGLCLHRVGAKAAHDYAEIFDGVPSQHDGTVERRRLIFGRPDGTFWTKSGRFDVPAVNCRAIFKRPYGQKQLSSS